MHVSGVVMRIVGGQLEAVAAALDGLPWADEVQRDVVRGLLVVTIEGDTARDLVDRAEALRARPHVADVTPVFHGFTDDAPDLRDLSPATATAARLDQPHRPRRSNAR
ncbi:MAG: chaperone NapD [Myxococcales bacterium]|nr:chaperone NapD [Myxococcales bacterium]